MHWAGPTTLLHVSQDSRKFKDEQAGWNLDSVWLWKTKKQRSWSIMICKQAEQEGIKTLRFKVGQAESELKNSDCLNHSWVILRHSKLEEAGSHSAGNVSEGCSERFQGLLFIPERGSDSAEISGQREEQMARMLWAISPPLCCGLIQQGTGDARLRCDACGSVWESCDLTYENTIHCHCCSCWWVEGEIPAFLSSYLQILNAILRETNESWNIHYAMIKNMLWLKVVFYD